MHEHYRGVLLLNSECSNICRLPCKFVHRVMALEWSIIETGNQWVVRSLRYIPMTIKKKVRS